MNTVNFCPDCESHHTIKAEYLHKFSYGNPNTVQLSCLIEAYKCEDCGYMWADGYQGEKIDAAISKYLLEKLS